MHHLKTNTILGILGGGQLGKMLLQKAADFNMNTHVLDPDENAPCRHLCKVFNHGDFRDYDAVMAFGNECDILTIEIENVNIEALYELEKLGKKVFPQPHIIAMAQDKGKQKQFYADHQLPTAPFYMVNNKEQIKKDRFPIVQKLCKGGYDGKGVKILRSENDLADAFNEPSVIENCIDIDKEIAVITARNTDGRIKTFPVVEMLFNKEANLVELLFSPSALSDIQQQRAVEIAENLIKDLGMVGLLAVEMFVTKTGEILINEIAPRPHNSGHHTIEANAVSQFEQHLRAIYNLPLADTSVRSAAAMINLLGEKNYTGDAIYEGLDKALQAGHVHIHLYGKKTTRPFRKMGHATITAPTVEEAISLARQVQQVLKIIS
ncbi:MAG TPA: 5-(carboxyamino)imidazole ribonucleotide synthase [Bacteroidia bacterium]|nr:MAG: phosphoribosylaminoimidazole carboxylase ATPase subunit [Bacteroidetes bacterium OLB10]MBX3105181.1 5-(carboxyamino)imidazole ribonucleotide synthase [Bacteroidota bacterium]MCB8930054.1 5-(carboxyamino)imidazole ribonucleotide synthase [Bacteroidia bacterium]MCO5288735.1 5-(carboxyamino)imidazole ribonucleotide synthase [Bacteroidota bacterium]MCW5931738.1 5-(carboxyamino)imidazole ribonucleotide synthase [Bacteroidota bacterium]